MRGSTMGARRYGRMAAMLLALLAVGCSLETDDSGIGLRHVFQASGDPLPDPGVPPTINVNVNAVGIITTNGQLVTQCDRGDLGARYSQQGENLAVHIVYRAPTNCTTAPVVLDYTVFLSNVPSGTYHFSVVHEGDRQVANGTTVAEQDVTIP